MSLILYLLSVISFFGGALRSMAGDYVTMAYLGFFGVVYSITATIIILPVSKRIHKNIGGNINEQQKEAH